MGTTSAEDLDIKAAASVAGRTAETIRRWVWSGRLVARKHGKRLYVSRRDVEALARTSGSPPISLREWAKRAEAALRSSRPPYSSAADLVLQERARRLDEVSQDRGR